MKHKKHKLNICISIIIVNWNGKKWLKKNLDSLLSQTFKNLEIIVVDNNSTDDSVDFVKNNYNEVRIIKSINKGFGHAANLGSNQASGVFLMFFNEDMYVENDFIQKFMEEYNKINDKTKVGTVGCDFLDYNKTVKFDIKPYGFRIDFMSVPAINFDKKRIFHNTGSPFFISKKLFLEVGGFCPNIFLYSEDIDLCWRLNLYGYKHYFLQDVNLYHFGGGVIGKLLTNRLACYIRGEINCILNNYSSLILPFALIYFTIFYLSLSFFYLLKGRIIYSKIIFATIYDEFRYNFKNIRSFRKIVQSKRKVSDFTMLIRGQINLIPARVTNTWYYKNLMEKHANYTK